MRITDRIQHAWNAFKGEQFVNSMDRGPSSSRSAHKSISTFNVNSYVSTIFNRIAIDAAMVKFRHVKIDPKNEDEIELLTGLNNCLTLEANIDQNAFQFVHDIVYSMFDEGVIAVVPVDTDLSPEITGGYDIATMRVGKIRQWYPKHVEIELYNERSGMNERIVMEKRNVAIIENPLYAIINSENSTLKRLINKLQQLDNVDDLIASGRLDLLISVPYGIKTDHQQRMAEERIKSIEHQLSLGKHGVAYIDGTEKAMQLNRPVNSQLLENIQQLNQQFHNQLGLTASVFDGTASESEMRNYYARSIDPIIENVVLEFNRKFITKTGRTQGQRIEYYRDLFKLVPIEVIVGLGDTFRRNEIGTSNEVRRMAGLKRSNDPRADLLENPNIADKNQEPQKGPSIKKTTNVDERVEA